ncbi:hypothetical protein GCM10009557_22760 [Virgisporangium ochraceum]|uniref:Uncharacterized protein n=1 Tax=Virgisporangium ochraceum TaxID=65505 RepID=A0A8J3ZQ19_9ACTN|nr:hypothetical protein Voc01_032160 [Virgisporangium ochraceum]
MFLLRGVSGPEVTLRGQMLYDDLDRVLFFVASPWVTDTAALQGLSAQPQPAERTPAGGRGTGPRPDVRALPGGHRRSAEAAPDATAARPPNSRFAAPRA